MSFDSDEMKALYGLRNSLMHDRSILYRGRFEAGKWKGPFHHFILGSKSVNIVELPVVLWDGNLATLTPAHRTKINQHAFTELAISAVRTAKQLLNDGDLGFSLTEGEIELYYRYLFHGPAPLRQKLLGIFHDAVSESPRELRRLHYLREWSHEQDEQIFPGS